MNDFVTIATFMYPTEVLPYKSRLEAEGIATRVLDELTVQVYNFYSNAIGGVKLQVLRADEKRAIEILLELGYLKEKDFEPFGFWSMIDRLTGSMALLNRLRVELRFLILAGIVFLILTLFYVWILFLFNM